MVRRYIVDAADLTLARARRHAANRLGFAVQLCRLRHLGAGFKPAEHPPMPALAFVAEQVGVPPTAFTSSTATRRAGGDAEPAGDDVGLKASHSSSPVTVQRPGLIFHRRPAIQAPSPPTPDSRGA